MAVNDKQKIIVLPIDANTKTVIEQRLAEGFVIQIIINLQPKYDSLLIVYATPPEIT